MALDKSAHFLKSLVAVCHHKRMTKVLCKVTSQHKRDGISYLRFSFVAAPLIFLGA
jgi:hypothetical protein